MSLLEPCKNGLLTSDWALSSLGQLQHGGGIRAGIDGIVHDGGVKAGSHILQGNRFSLAVAAENISAAGAYDHHRLDFLAGHLVRGVLEIHAHAGLFSRDGETGLCVIDMEIKIKLHFCTSSFLI